MDITNTPLKFELRSFPGDGSKTMHRLCLEGQPAPLATIHEHDDGIAQMILSALRVVEEHREQASRSRVVLERRYEFGSTVTPSKTKDDNAD
jgi:hypothetical protein